MQNWRQYCLIIHSVGDIAEKVTGKGRRFSLFFEFFVLRVNVIFTVVFSTAANLSESGKTRSVGCVGVDVDDLAALNVLKKSHSSVAGIVLTHLGVALTLTNVICRVLEDASLAVRALRGMLQEVLADRGQVLTAQTLLLLELILAVGKPTTLVLLAVLALQSLEPEAAQLSLHLLFPSIFVFAIFS